MAGKGGGEAKKAKKNPVPEFLFWYFGTLAAAFALDAYGVFPGRSFWELFPEGTSWAHLGAALLEDEFYQNNVKFILFAMAMAGPLHFWRKFVKALFAPLATRGSGLTPGTLKYDKYVEQAWLAVH